MQPVGTDSDARLWEAMTLEAYADTVVPGERRWPGDRVVAGAAEGGGAVASGALEVLRSPEGGLVDLLPSLAEGLNEHVRAYAAERDLPLDPSVPAFVSLPYADRTRMVSTLTAPGHPERDLWVALAMFSVMAWDTGAHMHTVDAIAAGHPGLTTLGYTGPDADGLWRFPNFSYGRALARPYPRMTSTGDPE